MCCAWYSEICRTSVLTVLCTHLGRVKHNSHSAHKQVDVAGRDSALTGLRAESLGHTARLLHCQLAPVQRQVSTPVLDLAEAVMATGVAFAEEPDALAMLKRYLPGLLKSLSSYTADASRCARAHSLTAYNPKNRCVLFGEWL